MEDPAWVWDASNKSFRWYHRSHTLCGRVTGCDTHYRVQLEGLAPQVFSILPWAGDGPVASLHVRHSVVILRVYGMQDGGEVVGIEGRHLAPIFNGL